MSYFLTPLERKYLMRNQNQISIKGVNDNNTKFKNGMNKENINHYATNNLPSYHSSASLTLTSSSSPSNSPNDITVSSLTNINKDFSNAVSSSSSSSLVFKNIKPKAIDLSPLNTIDTNLPSKYLMEKICKSSNEMVVQGGLQISKGLNDINKLIVNYHPDQQQNQTQYHNHHPYSQQYKQPQQNKLIQEPIMSENMMMNLNSNSNHNVHHQPVFPIPSSKNPSIIKRWKNKDVLFDGNYRSGATPIPIKRNIFDNLSQASNSNSNAIGDDIIKKTDIHENIGADSYRKLTKKHENSNNSIQQIINAISPFKMSNKPSKCIRNLFETEFNQEKNIKEDSLNAKNTKLFTEPGNETMNIQQNEDSLNMQQDTLHQNIINKNLFYEFNKHNTRIDLVKNNHTEQSPQSPTSSYNGFLNKLSTPTVKKPNYYDQHEKQLNDFLTIKRKEARNNASLDENKPQPFILRDNEDNQMFDYDTNNHHHKYQYIDSFKKSDESLSASPGYSRFTNDYTICHVLGNGYFGTVYTCQNKLDGQLYAIKCTHCKLKGTNMSQALNEAQALASLSALDENPFVVRYYNAWIEDDRLYLVMELCTGNLKSVKNELNRFNEAGIRHILRDICQGLRHLHNQKIVHLDIKPENILYSKTNKYKIGDLGLSRISIRQHGEDINEGDSRYLAPELLNDLVSADCIPDLTKADIFSLGISMYELMTGEELPKNGPVWHELRSGKLTKLMNLKNYSNSLKQLVFKMMSSNPNDRPSAHEILSNTLLSGIELELKWEKKRKELLKLKINEYEKKLTIKRRVSEC